MSVGVAFRAFFAALFQREAAERIRQALDSQSEQPKLAEPKQAEKAKLGASTEPKKPNPPSRSEALTLLGTLQREARFLDLVQESLDGFEDAQVGAAARDVLRDCRKTLDRMFRIEALAEQEEGETIEIPAKVSPNKLRLLGSSASTGTIRHRGWKASCCELPTWTGSRDEAWILAPTEVEAS